MRDDRDRQRVPLQQFDAFFESIATWRSAYTSARLHFFGVRTDSALSIVAARVYLDIDVPAAEESGILVLTRENLEAVLETELFRFPDVNSYFKRGIAQVEERRLARQRSERSG
jgi:hypothetical protein